ncbi:MAG TPA: hypothetical protein VNJ04_12065 [Gemmatimonadaceae bacterium]|nr:hypothetical protein [Gemmatimonadaceae bacterium]
MPAALPIAIGASAVANVVGAKMAAGASRGAAKIQSQSADRALGVNQKVYDEQRALFQPFVQGGSQAMGAMMQRYGNAGGPMAGYQAGPNPTIGTRPQAGPPGSALIGAPGMSEPMMSMRSVAPQQHTGKVLMQAPTGEQEEVDAHLVPMLTAKGARRIN